MTNAFMWDAATEEGDWIDELVTETTVAVGRGTDPPGARNALAVTLARNWSDWHPVLAEPVTIPIGYGLWEAKTIVARQIQRP